MFSIKHLNLPLFCFTIFVFSCSELDDFDNRLKSLEESNQVEVLQPKLNSILFPYRSNSLNLLEDVGGGNNWR